jgi:hypothetical protein
MRLECAVLAAILSTSGPPEPTAEELEYFSLGSLSPDEKSERIERTPQVRSLKRLGEAPLGAGLASEGTVYRLMRAPAFEPILMVRVEHGSGSGARLIWKEFDPGTDRKGSSIREGARPLSEEEWQSIERLAEASSFWTVPPDTFEFGFDGVTVTLEGARRGRYHVVHRWSPQGGSFFRFCRRLENLARNRDAGFEPMVVDPRSTGSESRGGIRGRVRRTKPDGVVPGVTVIIAGGGDTESRATDSNGDFEFDGLLPGLYELRFQYRARVQGRPRPVIRIPMGKDGIVLVRGGEVACLRVAYDEELTPDDPPPRIEAGCDQR